MVQVRRVLPWGRPLAALALGLALVPALAGCILTADKLDPALDVPDKYSRAKGDAEAALPSLAWWRGFRSAELTDLMEQAQTSNLDIAAAIARIVQADALAREAGAALLPNVTGSASDTRSRPSATTGTNAISVTDRTIYSTSLSASYVLDSGAATAPCCARPRTMPRRAASTARSSRSPPW
jgi:multidrug efflux system outer membrane protein